ncbi:hypothetical protein BGZ57DRAFT_988489 [Hyaloscypha finlandica]|nr:hypothetical protein BGZ57DRAFT_988489 [Hyaloscypha finlandica]
MLRSTLVILLARAATERATAHQSSMYSLQVTTSSGIINSFINSPFPDVRQFLGIICSSAFHSNASMTTADIPPDEYPSIYRGFELPLTFGTAGEYHRVSSTCEDLVNITLQDLWLDFSKDPHHGLRIVGWSPFPEGKAVLIGDTEMPVNQNDVSGIDGICGDLQSPGV